jgi:WD40 repeat protein
VPFSNADDIRQRKITPIGVFDATGLVFAVTTPIENNTGAPSEGQYLHLYDTRNYGVGAFSEFKVLHEDVENHLAKTIGSGPADGSSLVGRTPWHNLSFNQVGDRILASGDEGICVVVDGYEGPIQRVFRARTKHQAVACFTSDDQTVLAGQDDGSVVCYDIKSGSVMKTLSGHEGRVGAIACNPKMAQFASSCSQTALWCF